MTNARSLANFATGIGTEGAVLTVDNTNNRIGIATTNPQNDLQVGAGITMEGDTGQVTFVGVVTASSFSGDIITGGIDIVGNTTGLNVTGVGTFVDVNVSGAATIAGATDLNGALDVNGEVTVSPNTAGKNTITLTTNSSNDGRVLVKSDTTTKVDIQANGTSFFDGGSVEFRSADAVGIADSIFHIGDTNTKIRFPAADTFTVETGGSEALRVDSSQRLLIGATSTRGTHGGGDARLQIEGTNTATAGMSITRTSDDAGSPTFSFGKTRNGSALSDGDDVGVIYWQGDDGTDLHTALCSIKGEVDGSVSGNAVPGRITFNTATTSTNLTERLRITSAGLIGVNVTPTQQKLTIDVDSSGTTQASFDGINICNTDSTTNNGSAITFGQAIAGNSNARIGVINSDRSGGSEDQDIFFGTLGGGSYGERLRITSGGVLLVGATASVGEGGTPADLNSTEVGRGYINLARDDTSAADQILFGKNGSIASSIGTDTTNTLVFKTGTSERLRIDSSGHIVIKNPTSGGLYLKGIDGNGDEKILIGYESGTIVRIAESLRMDFGTTSLEPVTDNAVDLGQADKRWKNIYSADLQLSNEGSTNDVDGTWGQYTIQEGEDDLFLLNRRNGKTYKFVLEEVN